MRPDNGGKRITRFAGHLLTAKFLQSLAGGPKSLAELVEDSGVSYDSVRPFMKALHAHGVGVDAVRQKKKTQAQRSRSSYMRRLRGTKMSETKGEIGRIRNRTLDNALRGWG